MFRLTRLGAIVVAALLITAGSTFITSKDLPISKPEDVGLSSERLARMNKSIHEYVDAGRTPGVVTLIARHGKVVHVDAYGKADLASGRPTRADDIFRMYSMTKPITSVALLMLYEEGKFQLTDPLSRYFPAFADVKVYAGSTPQGGMLLDSLEAANHHPGCVPPFGGLQLRLRQLADRQGVSGRQRLRHRPEWPDGQGREAAAALPARRSLGLQRRPRRAGGAGRETLGTEVRRLRPPAHLRPARDEGVDVQGSCRQEIARAGALQHGPRPEARGGHQPPRDAATATRCSAGTASRRPSATTRSSRRCC